ncbi:MAG TPA: CRISPR-associated endonuclease Cas2 [Solirubrobacterales bacterium]|nr:CRISPR-associated endonuclease Cas2 [Solirubrobacterales bacterium]
MADRTRYLLAYDIRNPRRLRRVHQVAKAWGYPLQYSVFVCDLTKSELLMMKRELADEMSTVQDSVGIFDLGPPDGRGVKCVEFIGKSRDLPGTDAEIW